MYGSLIVACMALHASARATRAIGNPHISKKSSARGAPRADPRQNSKILAGLGRFQLILEKCETPLIEEVDELKETKRGERGFGSSGKN